MASLTQYELESVLYLLQLKKRCYLCGTPDTPMWRRYLQEYVVCNACGIKYSRKLKSYDQPFLDYVKNQFIIYHYPSLY